MLRVFSYAIRTAWYPLSSHVRVHRLLAISLLLIGVAGTQTLHLVADETLDSRQQGPHGEQPLLDLLQRYCFECHGEDTQEADIRLDTLDLIPSVGEMWEKILSAVSSGKMPPEDATMPTEQERALLVSRLEDGLDKLAAEASRTRRWTGKRRLTVEEYNFTMQELFGVDAEFADMLPADPVAETGYRNDRERLGLSSLQIEAYLDSARRSVRRYVQFAKRDGDQQALRYHIELEDLFYSTAVRYETRERAPQPVDADTLAARRTANLAAAPKYVDPLGPMLPGAYTEDEALRAAIPKLHQQYVAIPRRFPTGEMIVRVRAAGTADRDGRFPRMRVEAGITLGDGCSINKRVLGEVDVTAPLDAAKVYEFRIRLEDVPTKGPLNEEDAFDRLSVFDMDQIFISNVSCDNHAIFALGRGGYRDPATGSAQIADQLKQLANDGTNLLHLDCVEIEMFPGLGVDNGPYRWQVTWDQTMGGQAEESATVREFLGRFMRNAYRRSIAAEEVSKKLELFSQLRAGGYTFEESLRETLAAVLVSPSFLFLELSPAADAAGPPESPTPHQLASRLSYLLWLSPPDERLMSRADDGSLRQQSVLRREAERLLADPRSGRFLESFCRQWLRLDKLANVAVQRQVYPSHDDDLATLSLRETLAYFVDVFASDSSALDLIDSDYAILNDRLAEHYDVGEVIVGELHKVRLPEDSLRGGLLTQASLLTMNSDGVDSHSIRRGVWLLDRFLNRPPPPAPPNVPDIDASDPDLRGLSLKQRIELHRQPGACQSCHAKIDPWGIPFENFDATGRWRDKIEHRQDRDVRWRPVDAAAVLPDGQPITGIAELKRYLREQRGEQFANALVHHMLTYAMGRPPNFADRQQVQEIQDRFAGSQYRLKELVLATIDSPLFRH